MPLQQRCRKCGGNMFAREDMYGAYLGCLQCGRVEENTALGSLDEELEAILRPQRARLGLAAVRGAGRR